MVRALPVAALALALGACTPAQQSEAPAAAPQAAAPVVAESPDDPFLWLEGVEDQTALDWARERNAKTISALAESDDFKALESRILANLDSTARIPGVYEQGGFLYNFWRDAQNPRGLWRRTTLAEYRKAEPAWDVVIDLDFSDTARWAPEALKPHGTLVCYGSNAQEQTFAYRPWLFGSLGLKFFLVYELSPAGENGNRASIEANREPGAGVTISVPAIWRHGAQPKP